MTRHDDKILQRHTRWILFCYCNESENHLSLWLQEDISALSSIQHTGFYFIFSFLPPPQFLFYLNSHYKTEFKNTFVVFDFSVRCPLQINQIKSTWSFCHSGKYLSYTSAQSVIIESLSPEMPLGRLIPDKAAVWIIPQQSTCYAIPTFLRKKKAFESLN